MAGFFVHRSNSMEALLGALFGVLESSPADPWTPETIVLQGRGMERWLSMSLAKQFGIWSHARYPFPRAFVDELTESVVGPLTDDPYAPLPLTLTLARLLKSSPSDVVKRYVDEDPGRRYALAARLADLFDRYQVYRPEWVLRGFPDPNHWQAALWRQLVGQVGDEHFAKRAQSASRALEDGAGALPQRITVFGITTLPPSYLRLLKSFSKRRHVHFFVQTPSREFWGDSQRQLGMFNRGDGPRLLEVLGTHARDFQSLLETMGYEEGVEAYREPGTRGVLRTLQSDLLHYRRRGAGEDVEPVARAANDVSVQIHSCHSPMREAEVVHDLLLDCFERDKRLAPHEVAVLVPRIDDYAPYIDAVFGTRAVVPYRISDRSFGSSDPELVALEAWIDAASGRLGAAQVLDILEHEPIRSAFAIEEHSLEMIRHWVVESGIRWGYDRNHRVEHGHLDDETGTWRFGFDRLWMGFAVDERRHRRVGDFAPASLVSGSNVELLGALESIVESLARAGQFLNRSHSPQDWARWLEEQVDRFTAVTSRLRAEARNATLRFAGVDPEDSEDIPFETMHQLILVPLLRDSGRFGFGSGAVTVCEMLPMRSIPFDVVIVMGMNDQDFPRAPGRDGLDLTRLAPRRGD
ncbi:MAG: exodeoxyribonuclease V subunit gamma, partial [Myxococcota bacterium]